MSEVVYVDELPIGAGRRRVTKESAAAPRDDPQRGSAAAGAGQAPPPAPPALSLVTPAAEPEPGALWEPGKMRRPLQLVVGKTVNWQMRRRTGVETTAGLMSDDQADAINEPLAEIFNRFEPMRAIAAKQTEIALGIAIYDYVRETAVQAGRDVAYAEDRIAAARRQAQQLDVAAPPPLFPPAPPAEQSRGNDNLEEDQL